MRFRFKSAREHMRRHHPNCPPTIRDTIITEVCRREWRNATIGQAVGIVIDGHVRHRMTDYESLYNIPGLTREEARMIVQPDVLDIIASWAVKSTDDEQAAGCASTP